MPTRELIKRHLLCYRVLHGEFTGFAQRAKIESIGSARAPRDRRCAAGRLWVLAVSAPKRIRARHDVPVRARCCELLARPLAALTRVRGFLRVCAVDANQRDGGHPQGAALRADLAALSGAESSRSSRLHGSPPHGRGSSIAPYLAGRTGLDPSSCPSRIATRSGGRRLQTWGIDWRTPYESNNLSSILLPCGPRGDRRRALSLASFVRC
jgi:hypothetical protein